MKYKLEINKDFPSLVGKNTNDVETDCMKHIEENKILNYCMGCDKIRIGLETNTHMSLDDIAERHPSIAQFPLSHGIHSKECFKRLYRELTETLLSKAYNKLPDKCNEL